MTEDIYLNVTTKDLACLVCQDRASGNHYGVPTCDGCRGFFKRSVRKKAVYTCKNEGRCKVDALRRNQCQACRYKKCLEVKMNPEAVQLQRECRSAKRKIELDDTNDENIPTPVKIQKISPGPLSSPGIDSSINSSETSDHEHDRSLKTEDRPSLLHSRETHPPINPFMGLPPFPRLRFPCRPFFGPDLTFPLTRPSLTHSPFLPPPLLRLELLSAFNQCLSPVRGMPCMYFTCSLCLERILQSGSNHLSQRHDHGHELNGPKSQTA